MFRGLPVIKDFEVVKLSLMLLFVFIYVKITFKYAIWYTDSRKGITKSKIDFKDANGKWNCICTDSKHYVVLSTSDFVFVYNENEESLKAIPVANILCVTTNITES